MLCQFMCLVYSNSAMRHLKVLSTMCPIASKTVLRRFTVSVSNCVVTSAVKEQKQISSITLMFPICFASIEGGSFFTD